MTSQKLDLYSAFHTYYRMDNMTAGNAMRNCLNDFGLLPVKYADGYSAKLAVEEYEEIILMQETMKGT